MTRGRVFTLADGTAHHSHTATPYAVMDGDPARLCVRSAATWVPGVCQGVLP